jgi:membrane-associated phospholipid phosphatase
MPGAHGVGGTTTFVEAVVPLLHSGWNGTLDGVANVVTLPGQVVVSFLLVLGAAAILRRRGRQEAAAAWPAALVLGTAIEVVCKHAIVRPALARGGEHVPGFDSSWPSGHTIRILLVAAAFAVAVPGARVVLALWAAAALVLLELAGVHTPSDIGGGILLAALLALGAAEVERSGLLRRRAAGGALGGRGLRRRRARAAPRRPG